MMALVKKILELVGRLEINWYAMRKTSHISKCSVTKILQTSLTFSKLDLLVKLTLANVISLLIWPLPQKPPTLHHAETAVNEIFMKFLLPDVHL